MPICGSLKAKIKIWSIYVSSLENLQQSFRKLQILHINFLIDDAAITQWRYISGMMIWFEQRLTSDVDGSRTRLSADTVDAATLVEADVGHLNAADDQFRTTWDHITHRDPTVFLRHRIHRETIYIHNRFGFVDRSRKRTKKHYAFSKPLFAE